MSSNPSGLVLAAACAACSAAPGAGSAPPASPTAIAEAGARVTGLADAYVRAYIETFPEAADQAGLLGAPHGGLADRSLAAQRAWDTRVDGWLAELAHIDGASLWGRPEWVTHGFLREVLESSRDLRSCHRELWPIDSLNGWQVTATTIARLAPVATPAERTQALDRFGRLAAALETDRANAEAGLARGYSSPESVVVLVIRQFDGLLAATTTESPLYEPARRSTDAAFQAQWAAILERQLVPAMRAFRAYLDTYRPRARKALGVSALPDGASCYAASFRAFTTLRREPDETVRLGEALVTKNVAEVRALRPGADIPAIVAGLDRDPQNHFADRDQIQAFATEIIGRARAAMPRWFGRLPSSDVILEPIPAHLEAAAPSGYRPAAQDGSRPAHYLINLGHPEQQRRANVEITALHETYPGHHLQIGLETDARTHGSTTHPIALLAGSSAFREGWARYAESLAEELALYRSDHARINRRLWPGRGMVVDPGIHLRGWTRQQAIDYMMAAGRFSAPECDAFVDRVAVWPGQLTAYDTGALELFALRADAERTLGARFDLRAFHDAVLAHGAVTLPMLREIGRRWIDAQRAAGS